MEQNPSSETGSPSSSQKIPFMEPNDLLPPPDPGMSQLNPAQILFFKGELF
jgi:hypothetical protein